MSELRLLRPRRGPETAKAPRSSLQRLIIRKIPQRVASKSPATAWCLEIHDLVLSKCVAGRDRDGPTPQDTLEAGMVQADLLLTRLTTCIAARSYVTTSRSSFAGVVASL